MKRCGMDLGSRQVKLVLIEDGVTVLKKSFDTAAFYREYGRTEDGELSVGLSNLGLPKDVPLTVTGYGRNAVKVKGAQVISEVKAHALGAVFQTGLSGFVLLDIGGQDTKVVKVSGGRMEDFTMNDKCAASSGRYIENMANVLSHASGRNFTLLRKSRPPLGHLRHIRGERDNPEDDRREASGAYRRGNKPDRREARPADAGPVPGWAGGLCRRGGQECGGSLFHQGKDGPRPCDRPRPVIQRGYRLRDIR